MKAQVSAPDYLIHLAVNLFDHLLYPAMRMIDNIVVKYFVRTAGSIDFNWFALLSVIGDEVIKPAAVRIHTQILLLKNIFIRLNQVRTRHYRHMKQLCCE